VVLLDLDRALLGVVRHVGRLPGNADALVQDGEELDVPLDPQLVDVLVRRVGEEVIVVGHELLLVLLHDRRLVLPERDLKAVAVQVPLVRAIPEVCNRGLLGALLHVGQHVVRIGLRVDLEVVLSYRPHCENLVREAVLIQLYANVGPDRFAYLVELTVVDKGANALVVSLLVKVKLSVHSW
jgi:hypothetical protein